MWTLAGLLYGVGHLLKKLHWRPGSAGLERPINLATSPFYAVRGHEIGHRNTANTYDAWDVATYDQYIRELALFGVNAIENTPLHELDETSPVLRVPKLEMNAAMSGICNRYDLDFWVWTPADFDLEDPARRDRFTELHRGMYEACPRLDAVLVPGGDPGTNHPRVLLPYMAELAPMLRARHPEAEMWTSLSKFEPPKAQFFYEYIERNQPDWLTGIVHQPWSPAIAEVRAHLPERYRYHVFADVTHNVRCQFPVPWWDPAYAHTLGREATNPRPVHYSGIARAYMHDTEGFMTYSDGVHDDVNKCIWNAIGWDPTADVREALVDYARFFFGPDVAERAADGILALERNWYGSLAQNGGVDATLDLWQTLDRENPQLRGNWRWQNMLLRANYDAWVRQRLLHERALEAEASRVLAQASEIGADTAMNGALAVLAIADSTPVRPELRAEIERLGDELFRSIGMQLSVERYGAKGAERGAVLDALGIPLSDRWWLEDEIARVREMPDAGAQVARLVTLGTWENPGTGSFYDDVGNVACSPHVLRGEGMDTDPMLERTPFPFFMWWENGYSRKRRAWQSDIHWPTLVYREIDPNASYTVRATGKGTLRMRINGELVQPTTDTQEIGEFRIYPVPARAVRTGTLTLTWDDVDAGNIHWRQYSRVNEVWLLRD